MTPWTEYTLAGFEAEVAGWGDPPVHAKRLLREFYRTAGQPDLTDRQIGNGLRQRLKDRTVLRQSKVMHAARSADGTVRFLVELARGGAVETVLMPSHKSDRAAGCVSSQIGCAMGCDFCASTKSGLQRSLTAGEIVEQFLHLKQAAAEVGRRLITIVFMGQGEPMHNLDHVMEAIKRIAGPELAGIGWRHVTVSTVGIVPGIDRLAEADLNVHLAVSLHAPDDETRSRIVPTNKRYPVAEVLAATQRFYDRTKRIATIEYCMLDGINDSDAQATLLADLLGNLRAHVNLIPYNSIGAGISGIEYRRPGAERMRSFLNILRSRGLAAHFRTTRGDDVNAACGQLRETLVGIGNGKRAQPVAAM